MKRKIIKLLLLPTILMLLISIGFPQMLTASEKTMFTSAFGLGEMEKLPHGFTTFGNATIEIPPIGLWGAQTRDVTLGEEFEINILVPTGATPSNNFTFFFGYNDEQFEFIEEKSTAVCNNENSFTCYFKSADSAIQRTEIANRNITLELLYEGSDSGQVVTGDVSFKLVFKPLSVTNNGMHLYTHLWTGAESSTDNLQTVGPENNNNWLWFNVTQPKLSTPSISLTSDSEKGGLSYSITDSNTESVTYDIKLYDSTIPEASVVKTITATTDKNGTVDLSDVTADTTYYAKVKANPTVDSTYAESDWSALSAGATASKIKLVTPTVTLSLDTVLKVTVNDAANTAGVSKYEVQIFEVDAQDEATGTAVFTSTSNKDTAVEVIGINTGKKYIAKAKAVADTTGNYMDSEISSSNVVAYKGAFPEGLSINVDSDLKYTGSPVNVNPQISGGQLNEGSYEFKYKGRNSTSYDESTTAPTLPGDYTATLALTDAGKDVYLEPDTYPETDFAIAKGVQTATLSVEGTTGDSYTYGSTTTPLKLKISGLEEIPTVTYSIESGTGAAMINNDNTLTITKAGTLNLKAEYEATDNYESGSATYTLTVNKGILSLASNETTKSVGELITLSDLITLKNEAGVTVNLELVTYDVQSNNVGAATGSQTTITPTSAGVVVVKVSTAGSDLYNALSNTDYTITVNDLPKTTITFHKNDGTVETSTQSITEKLTEKLNKNSFTRAGYTFEGWALTQSGEVKYTDEADYKANAGNQTLDLYAQWKAIPITEFSYGSLNSAEVGKEYTSAPIVTPTSIDGGSYTYSFISKSIDSANIDSSTGVITFKADSKGEVEFTIKVEHPNGSSKETTVKIEVVLNKLTKPNALTADDVTTANKSITIITSNSDYEYSLKDANGTLIKTVKGNGSSLVFDGLRADTEYILVQRAKGEGTTNSDSDWSDDYKLKTAEAEAPVIGTLKAEAKDSSILLSWTVTDDGGASITSAKVTYKYKVKENGVDEVKNGTQTFTNLNDAKSVTLTGLTNGTEYYDIQVTINNGKDSSLSNDVQATPKKTQSGGNGGGGSFGGGGSSSKNEGWKEEKGGIYYYENGKIVTGFKDIESKTYYFDNDGKMVTGFNDIKNKTYYFDTKGVMKKASWFYVSKKTYYAYEDGVIAKGWLPIEKEWYYMHPTDGHMVKDWVKDDGSWYFMGPEGNMWRQHWAPGNNNWYYVDMDGKMIYNTWIPSHSGYWYYIGSDGSMVTNAMVDGCWINSLGIYHSPIYQG